MITNGSTEPEPDEEGRRLSCRPTCWAAGIVNHGSHEDLERCLASLARQTHLPSFVVVYDTGRDPERLMDLERGFPGVAFESGPNRGYAGGANRILDRIARTGDSVDFVLLLNPDVELEPEYAERLIAEMIRCPNAAIGTGKLLRRDGRTLDSAGIVLPRHRRPRDRGSELPDRGQFDVPAFVDAASGASIMLRASALSDLAIDGELFDEDFFVYHEDTDLCWRARRFGWQILYAPAARGIHERGWQKGRRRGIPIETRRHSFKNHYLQIAKNETIGGFAVNLPWLVGWEVLRLGFVLLRDRPLFPAYRDAWKALPNALRKRRLIRSRTRSSRATRLRTTPDEQDDERKQ